jgi:hypothetical protein
MPASKTLALKLRKNKLDLCMIIMGELRKTYWGADFAYNFFWQAQDFDGRLPSSQNEQGHQVTQPESPAFPASMQDSRLHNENN